MSWKEAGQAIFELPPESSMTVLFEKIFGTELRISGELSGSTTTKDFDQIFRIDQIEAAESLILSERQRHGQGSLLTSETGFELRWIGDVVPSLESSTLEDPELAEQLRALGYTR
jgi:hypothetical protein